MTLKRRDFLAGVSGVLGTSAILPSQPGAADAETPSDSRPGTCQARDEYSIRPFNGSYTGEHLNHVAFPLGGMGAGMFCVEGNGALTQFSLRHRPNLTNNEPIIFAALAIKGSPKLARILQGSVPPWKLEPRSGRAGAGDCRDSTKRCLLGDSPFAPLR